VTTYGHGSVCQCGCADAGDGIVALNRVQSGMFLCSVQSAIECRVIVSRATTESSPQRWPPAQQPPEAGIFP